MIDYDRIERLERFKIDTKKKLEQLLIEMSKCGDMESMAVMKERERYHREYIGILEERIHNLKSKNAWRIKWNILKNKFRNHCLMSFHKT